MMTKTADSLLKYVPIMVLAAGVIGTGYVTLDRQAALAADVEDLSESVDLNEDEIEALNRLLIQRQGAVDLRTQRIELEQQAQGDDLEQILLLLQQLRAGQQ